MTFKTHISENELYLPLDSLKLSEIRQLANKNTQFKWVILKERRAKVHKASWKFWKSNYKTCYRLYKRVLNGRTILSLNNERIASYEYEFVNLDYGRSEASSIRVILAYLLGVINTLNEEKNENIN